MDKTPTQMRLEILEIPQAVDRLLTSGADEIARAGQALRELDPPTLISVARGSSDHVATYLKYATELLTGVPVASVGPSIASIYHKELKLGGCAAISVSQSGKSPDIVDMAKMAKAGGALSIALTNDDRSPLAGVSDYALDIHAGPELSVAATKSFVNSAVAGIWLLSEWVQDEGLGRAIRDLPECLERAVEEDWPRFQEALEGRSSLYCLGRGPASAISNEAALKFKETCQIHAESYSSAELLHGPVSIVEGGFPVLGLTSADDAESALSRVADEVAGKGACVFATSKLVKQAAPLPVVRSGHPLTDPVCLISSFYAMVEKIAVSRGINPDAPRHLRKVTKTV